MVPAHGAGPSSGCPDRRTTWGCSGAPSCGPCHLGECTPGVTHASPLLFGHLFSSSVLIHCLWANRSLAIQIKQRNQNLNGRRVPQLLGPCVHSHQASQNIAGCSVVGSVLLQLEPACHSNLCCVSLQVVGRMMVVQASGKQRVLDEGSILWRMDTREPLGRVGVRKCWPSFPIGAIPFRLQPFLQSLPDDLFMRP
jgi:hypothetical protein